MGTLDHIKQRNYESLGNFYTWFNKVLDGINQVLIGGDTMHAFVRVERPRSSVL